MFWLGVLATIAAECVSIVIVAIVLSVKWGVKETKEDGGNEL